MNLRSRIETIPWWDTHSHLACHDGVGKFHNAFASDCRSGVPVPKPDLFFLLTSPFIKWMAGTIGCSMDTVAVGAGFSGCLDWAERDPGEWWNTFFPVFRALDREGRFAALKRGLEKLHGIRLRFEPDFPVEHESERIREKYETPGFYGFYREAARKLNMVRAVKLVELPYYEEPPADSGIHAEEKDLFVTALRVDSFTTLHLPESALNFRLRPGQLGLRAETIEEYLASVDGAVHRALENGCRGLKNAYSYFGPLDLPLPDRLRADRYLRDGKADPEGYRAFESVVLHRFLEIASEHRLPYQFHAGVAQVPWCNPARLTEQIRKHPDVTFHLLHVYPYAEEAGCLARFHPNVFLDPCWLSIFSPHTLRNTLREWIGLVPPERMMYGIDATTVEEWYGAALIAREVLTEVLEEKIQESALSSEQAIETAEKILGDTAQRYYGEKTED